MLIGLFAWALGIERFGLGSGRRDARPSEAAALVALRPRAAVSGPAVAVDLLGLVASATWAWYTVAVSPLLHRY